MCEQLCFVFMIVGHSVASVQSCVLFTLLYLWFPSMAKAQRESEETRLQSVYLGYIRI